MRLDPFSCNTGLLPAAQGATIFLYRDTASRGRFIRTFTMPIYEYSAKNASKSCPFCVTRFECTQRISEAPLTRCPLCSAPVVKLVSRPAIGWSRTGLDGRAKAAGFKKLKKIGRGEYEQQF